ncbi:DoxX family protein [Mucilaginibacter myungsuensis]|uniref:DoxX family protein n=1 Tax=Mucilaginibacter myungsuensis TaxID=649104 RepID=A0A929KUI2_9SPHI|nr:DoxX family protein [Mucilaginibacter myungsuensis]MBE9660658.1 DoxX family protein [Mucilaginibacter myungsuensis]MDN3600703.1 DoxX family protein [Mucilaginibacter myungsuensis]
MKATKITYWVTTAIVSLMMVFSAYKYLTDPAIDAGFKHMGFASYFRIELAVAKILGAIVLLAPVATRFKEWAYAGFGIVFISATIAHIASGDPVPNRVMPMIFFALLIASYVAYHKLKPAVS